MIRFIPSLCVAMLALTGCPTPPESTGPGSSMPAPAPGGPGNPPPAAPADGGGEAAPPADAGDAAGTPPSPGSGAGVPADADAASFVPINEDQPSFSTLSEEGGETITISVTVNGSGKGQIDFMVTEGDAPKVVHVEPFDNPSEPLSIPAPATYGETLTVSAFSHDNPSMGSAGQEITLNGEDISLELTLEALPEGDGAPSAPPVPNGADAAPAPDAPAPDAPAEPAAPDAPAAPEGDAPEQP